MSYQTLRRERIRQGITQQEMAQLLGLASKNAYSQKERGERKFCVEEALIIARELNVSVEGLFFQPEVNEMVTI